VSQVFFFLLFFLVPIMLFANMVRKCTIETGFDVFGKHHSALRTFLHPVLFNKMCPTFVPWHPNTLLPDQCASLLMRVFGISEDAKPVIFAFSW